MRRLLPLLMLGLLAATGTAHAQSSPTYVVFFQQWSAALDNAALGVVRRAAGWAKSHPQSPIQVTGPADTTGSQQANALLSQLRAQMVTDQLVADGVSGQRVTQSGVGAVPSAMSTQQARRVQISFPGS